MKYNGFYWAFFHGAIQKSVSARLGPSQAKAVMARGKGEYRRVVDAAPDLGRGNPLGLNAYFAYVYVGVWLGARGALSPGEMGKIMGESLSGLRWLFGLIDFNRPSGVRLAKKLFMTDYLKWRGGPGAAVAASWGMAGGEEPRPGLYYELTSCPICAHCQALGIPEIMPPLCEMDELMFSMMHGRLTRRQTIAGGGSKCDYWVVGDRS